MGGCFVAVLGEALDFGISTNGRWWEAEVYRLEGEILSSMQVTARAKTAYMGALDVARATLEVPRAQGGHKPPAVLGISR